MPLWAAAYLNMFSIRQRARSQHSRPAPVALMSEVRTCRTTEPCSNRVSWRAGPYPLISTISSASITVTVVVERTTWDWWGSVVSSVRGAHWVTYRRAPLTELTTEPHQSQVVRSTTTVTVMLAEEIVEINGYGPARQLTLFEHGSVVLQVLTSDMSATGAGLLCWLRARWRIENMFKYAAAHNGIDTLADYLMDIGPDHRKVTNPARTAARDTVHQGEAELAAAERALPQLLAGPLTPGQMNAALPGLHHQIETATRALADAKTALRPIHAKILATDLDPDAKLARPRIERRGLQMVLRLLAFNAEAWLADHLNAYLTDPDEYRAIARHLLHLGGQVDYATHAITITLDRPDSPRIARALALLTEEFNAMTASLPGDNRPLTYQLPTP